MTGNEPHHGAIDATAATASCAIAGSAVGMIPAVIATGRFGYETILSVGVRAVAVATVLASLSGSIGQHRAASGSRRRCVG